MVGLAYFALLFVFIKCSKEFVVVQVWVTFVDWSSLQAEFWQVSCKPRERNSKKLSVVLEHGGDQIPCVLSNKSSSTLPTHIVNVSVASTPNDKSNQSKSYKQHGSLLNNSEQHSDREESKTNKEEQDLSSKRFQVSLNVSISEKSSCFQRRDWFQFWRLWSWCWSWSSSWF